MAAFLRTQIIPVRDFSDADASHRPKPDWKLVDPPHLWLEKLASAWLARQGRPINPNLRYYLDRLPGGYAVFERARPSKGNSGTTDKHLYGHPKHKFFDSPNRFAPHFVHLMQHGTNKACPCTVCNASSTTPARPMSVISLPFTPPGPTQRTGYSDVSKPTAKHSDRSDSDVATDPDVKQARHLTELDPNPSKDQSHTQIYRRLPAAILRTRDEEDIPDTVRWLLDRLKSEKKSLDEAIEEPLSMDWRAEHEMLNRDIANVTTQHAWIPRKAEIVLFVRSIDGEICFDNNSKTYKIFDETLNRFTGYPKWEAGVVGQTASEPLSLRDILMETHKTRVNPVDSGFRIEPIPDPNDFADKAWTKRYKYVPLHHIRPMAFWQDYMAGIAEEERHVTIAHALKCMSSFALVGRHRFKGTWPTAEVFHKAIQIGAELISVGDAVRVLPLKDSKSQSSSKSTERHEFVKNDSSEDVLVLHISSIRLKFSEVENASIDDYDSGQPYKTGVSIVGRAFTLNPMHAYDSASEPVSPALLPPGMQGYDTWRIAHQPDKLFSVPLSRVAGRCIEAEAMLLWHPGRAPSSASRSPSLSIGLSDIKAARAYATKHDARINRAAKKSWFWADTRAELLGIMTLNGIAIDAWAGLRGQDVLDEQRHAINVLEKGAGRAERVRLAEVRQRNGGDSSVKMRGLAGGRMGIKAAAATAAAAEDQGDAVKTEDEDDIEEYVVERLLQKQTLEDGTEVYEVQWQDSQTTTWEPASTIAIDAPAMVRAFEKAQLKQQHQITSPSGQPVTTPSNQHAPPDDKARVIPLPADDEEQEYIVQSLRSKRKHPGTGITEYEVKWQGWPTTTWEPATQLLEDAPNLVRRFEKRLAMRKGNKPGNGPESASPSRGGGSSTAAATRLQHTAPVKHEEVIDIGGDSSAGEDTKHESMRAAFQRGAAVRAARASSASRGYALAGAGLAHRGKRKRGTQDAEGSNREDHRESRRQRTKTESEGKAVVWIDGAGDERRIAEEEHARDDEDDNEKKDEDEDEDNAGLVASNAIKDWVNRVGDAKTSNGGDIDDDSEQGGSDSEDELQRDDTPIQAPEKKEKKKEKPSLLAGWLKR